MSTKTISQSPGRKRNELWTSYLMRRLSMEGIDGHRCYDWTDILKQKDRFGYRREAYGGRYYAVYDLRKGKRLIISRGFLQFRPEFMFDNTITLSRLVGNLFESINIQLREREKDWHIYDVSFLHDFRNDRRDKFLFSNVIGMNDNLETTGIFSRSAYLHSLFYDARKVIEDIVKFARNPLEASIRRNPSFFFFTDAAPIYHP